MHLPGSLLTNIQQVIDDDHLCCLASRSIGTISNYTLRFCDGAAGRVSHSWPTISVLLHRGLECASGPYNIPIPSGGYLDSLDRYDRRFKEGMALILREVDPKLSPRSSRRAV